MIYDFDPTRALLDIAETQRLSGVGQWSWRACNCVGGPNCCIKVAEREREAAIRADERAKVLAEQKVKR